MKNNTFPHSKRRYHKSTWFHLVGIVIFIFIVNQIDFSKSINILQKISFNYLILAILLNIPMILIKAYRWKMMLSNQNIYYSSFSSIIVYASSIFIGIVTPGRIGEFVKAYFLKNDLNISISKGMSSVIGDRLFDLYFLLIIGNFGFWYFKLLGKVSYIFFILDCTIIALPILIYNKRFMKKIVNFLYRSISNKAYKEKIETSFNEFYQGVDQLIAPNIVFQLILTVFAYLFFFLQCYFLVISLQLNIDFLTITLFMSISNLISLIPISIGGIGTRDAVLIYLFSMLSINSEYAVSYSLLILFTFLIGNGFFGGIAWWIKSVQMTVEK
ncbi:MAG: lysylphosphatidylglycerol synthase transmembrane domain-containing protein [Spirochaetota bacterium]|nr:lysylphosphatidylglycerol synthase transmembrane domain-containing protein [Spirochaetota bacterium]